MFEIEIAGQMAAWFLHRERVPMPHLKLMKLLYIAERTSIQKNGYPVLGDKLFSMDHGPVLSITLNYMKGEFVSPDNGWDKWVSPVQDHEVSLARRYNPEDLNLLSGATLEILAEVWEDFGHMDQWEIRDCTHNFPEWQDPKGSSRIITYKELLDALGYGEKSAETAEELEAQRQVRKTLLT